MRFLVAFIGAPVITFLLLLFMAGLINQNIDLEKEKRETPYFDLVVMNKDESYESRAREREKPPEPEVQQNIEVAQVQQAKVSQPEMSIELELPSIDLSSHVSAMAISMPGIESMQKPVSGVAAQSMAMPLYREDPKYPRRALRMGKQGHVTLSFDINEAGRVVNIQVLQSNPSGLFDRAAKSALTRWKYKPMVVDGNAVSQLGQKIRLDFKLEQ